MNDFMIFLYLTFFVAILGATFAFMFKTMTATFDEMNKPVSYTHLRAHET